MKECYYRTSYPRDEISRELSGKITIKRIFSDSLFRVVIYNNAKKRFEYSV